MGEEFTQLVLKMVVGKICQPLGWHAMTSSAGDVLADVMKQYLLSLSKTASAYSAHGG